MLVLLFNQGRDQEHEGYLCSSLSYIKPHKSDVDYDNV